MEKIKNALSSLWCIPIVLFIGLLGWALGIDVVSVPIVCAFASLVLFFCDDVKNVFIVVFAVPFLPNGFNMGSDFYLLGAGVGLFFISIIFFLIKHLAVKKTPVKKGKLFWGFVASLVAYLIGGIWGYFNILNALIILVLTSATYFLYWIAINFTTNFRKFMNYLFIGIGVLLSFQLIISYAKVEGTFFEAITRKGVCWIGLQNINVVSTYAIFAMLSTFQLALKHKRDYLIVLAGLLFFVLNYFTYSRMGLLVCVILLIPSLIYIFIKSSNKKIFLIIAGACVAIAGIALWVFWDKISQIFNHYLSYGFKANGREKLWPWCWQKFLENPVFGIGFMSENVPGISANTFVLAHNTVLQYLSSLGIVGTLLMAYYFVERYRIICSNFNSVKLFTLLHVLAIALCGITDQAEANDVFLICIGVALVALAEIDSAENPKVKEEKVLNDNSEEKFEAEKINNGANIESEQGAKTLTKDNADKAINKESTAESKDKTKAQG